MKYKILKSYENICLVEFNNDKQVFLFEVYFDLDTLMGLEAEKREDYIKEKIVKRCNSFIMKETSKNVFNNLIGLEIPLGD